MAFFFMVWAVAAVLTASISVAADPSDVSGSSADFETFGNTVYSSEELELDRPVASGSNPVSAAFSFANTATDWVTYLFRSAALSHPMWEGWATGIRYFILVLQIPMLLLILFEGAKVLSGFIPFT